MQPSKYQQAIMEWFAIGDGNAIVDAKAGSGKTSTLCMLADMIPSVGTRAAFLAFNKSIADELRTRLPKHVDAATFHAICRAPLARQTPASRGRDWVNKNKVHHILDTLAGNNPNIERLRKGTVQLVGLMKANAMLPDVSEFELMDLIARYDIEFDEDDNTSDSVRQGITLARTALTINNNDITTIDFDDMLYLTYIMRLPVQKYTHLFVDECQDLNKVQRLLIARMLTPTSRLIAVGDPSQAIYGFRGADAESMNNTRKEFACQSFPLSISYRCPASVVRLAQSIVSDIEARDNAPEGTVSTLGEWHIDAFDPSDFVVCRNTAPLITLAFKFIRSHKAVRVMGRDIGEGLIALVKKMKARNLEDLADKLDEYTKREVTKAVSKREDAKAERLTDQYDSLIAVIEGIDEDNRSIYAVIDTINRLFTDKCEGKRTTLSTIHKAKGMEAHRVFILDAWLMPSKWAKQPWQQVQESNLRYVAITRSLDSLHFVASNAITY